MDATFPLQRGSGEQEVPTLVVSATDPTGTSRDVSARAGSALSIGKAADNDLVLDDGHVSRYHAEFVLTPLGVRVRDLGSTNGTFAGEVRLGDAVVPLGARLRVGRSTIEVRAGDTERTSAPVVDDLPGVVAASPKMRDLLLLVHKLAASHVNVLISGETGTGKERLAEAIHTLGPRAEEPFEIVDCAALPIALVTSELFGHERGAFTGALDRHLGAFERADGGTVFLDEVGELPLTIQATLLGVLERKCFRRLGGRDTVRVDVRVLCATNRDLRVEVNADRFRPDLYFRLAATRIVVPPLRERREDIEPLVRYFAREMLGPQGDAGFSAEALKTLSCHHWPGNVRELRNVVESALALGELRIDEPDGPAGWVAPERSAASDSRVGPYRREKAAVVAHFEADYLRRLMAEHSNNLSEAARRAGLDRGYVLAMLRRHGMR